MVVGLGERVWRRLVFGPGPVVVSACGGVYASAAMLEGSGSALIT